MKAIVISKYTLRLPMMGVMAFANATDMLWLESFSEGLKREVGVDAFSEILHLHYLEGHPLLPTEEGLYLFDWLTKDGVVIVEETVWDHVKSLIPDSHRILTVGFAGDKAKVELIAS